MIHEYLRSPSFGVASGYAYFDVFGKQYPLVMTKASAPEAKWARDCGRASGQECHWQYGINIA
jgi:hypothetical protein